MKSNILVVDYGMGNLRSVQKAIEHVTGAHVLVSANPNDVDKAECVVLPGVGAFDDAVLELNKRNLYKSIEEHVKKGKPYLGLCLGLQLLFEESEEGKEKGFGFLQGKVAKFPKSVGKIPHMGWNSVQFKTLFNEEMFFYFVHSYYAAPQDSSLIEGQTNYNMDFTAVIQKDNLTATQFHPEKSQENGLLFLKKYFEGMNQ